MQKRLGIITLTLLLFLNIQGQPTLNLMEADKHSYELFLKGDWHELINYARSARGQGIDFFYLQVRTGIAYYNLQRYRMASEWFLKAWESNSEPEWLQEYVYYSLLFGGRFAEAYAVAGNFTDSIQQKINYAAGNVTRVAFEAGYSFNPEFKELQSANHDIDAEVGPNYGEAFYLKNYHFESFDLNHRISPKFSLNHNFTYINIDRKERVDWNGRNDFGVKTNQFQYFLNPHLIFWRKLYFSPSMSLVWGNYDYSVGVFNGYSASFEHKDRSYSDHVFSASLWSHFGNFAPGGEWNMANIGDKGFSQYSAWITYYPFSNANVYLTPRIYFKRENGEAFGSPVLAFSGGFPLGPMHFWGQYLTGEMENFIESAGYVISNFPGTSTHKFSGSLFFPKGKKYQFILRYINQDITESYQVYTNAVKSSTFNYSFVKHTLIAGIAWNF